MSININNKLLKEYIKKRAAMPIEAIIALALILGVILIVFFFLFGPGKDILYKLGIILPNYNQTQSDTTTSEILRYNIQTDEIEYNNGIKFVNFKDKTIALNDKIISHSPTRFYIANNYFYKMDKRTPIIPLSAQTTDSLFTTTEIFKCIPTCDASLKFRYDFSNSLWQAAYGSNWVNINKATTEKLSVEPGQGGIFSQIQPYGNDVLVLKSLVDKNFLQGLTIINNAEKKLVPLPQDENCPYVITQHQASDLCFRYNPNNKVWEWSPDKTNWMPSPQTIVTEGRFKNQEPIKQNREIIKLLENKDFKQGEEFLKKASSEYYISITDFRKEPLSERAVIKGMINNPYKAGIFGEINFDITDKLEIKKVKADFSGFENPKIVETNSQAYREISQNLNNWRNSIFNEPVEIREMRNAETGSPLQSQWFCIQLKDKIYLVINLASPVSQTTQCPIA